MTDKTKAQLRAEAVERLKKINSDNSPKPWAAALGVPWNSDNVPKTMGRMKAALIDLLTDEPTNVTADGTNVTASDSPLIERLRSVHGLHEFAELSGFDWEDESDWTWHDVACAIADMVERDYDTLLILADMVERDYDTLLILADMVERDYVRREEYDAKRAKYSAMRDRAWSAEAERDEWKAKADDWIEMFNQAEHERCDALMALDAAERERDEWMAKAQRLDADGTADGTCPDGEPCIENYMDAGAEPQNPRSQEGESGKHVNSEGSKVTFAESRTFADMSEKDGGCVRDECRMSDTREKLEAEIMDRFPAWQDRIPYPASCLDVAKGWLDRQAAIIERETLCRPDERDEQIAELTAERDMWKERCETLMAGGTATAMGECGGVS